MKLLVAAIVGLVIGALGSWLYMDGRLQPALQRISQAESSRDLAAKAAKALEEQLREPSRRPRNFRRPSRRSSRK